MLIKIEKDLNFEEMTCLLINVAKEYGLSLDQTIIISKLILSGARLISGGYDGFTQKEIDEMSRIISDGKIIHKLRNFIL